MADRGMSAGLLTYLATGKAEFYHLVRIDFTVPVYYTTAPYDIDYGGNTYISSPVLGKIPTIVESRKIRPNTISLEMSGASAAMHALTLTENYSSAEVYIYRHYPTEAETITLFYGFVDSYNTTENIQKGTSSVTWHIANHWTNWEAKSGRLLNDDDWQRVTPGDVTMRSVGITDHHLVYWGRLWESGSFWWLPGGAEWINNQNADELQEAGEVVDAKAELSLQENRVPVVYGEARLKGAPIFRDTTGWQNQYLHVVYSVCEGEIESIDDIILGEDENGNPLSYTDPHYAGQLEVEIKLGAPAQGSFASLSSQSAAWTYATRDLTNLCAVHIRYNHDESVFPGGVPDPVFVVKGKKLYDPRTSTTAYSTNPALVLRDYLTNTYYGKSIPSSLLANINAAADFCDVTFTDHNGGEGGTPVNIPRFDFKGVLPTKNSVKKNVESILFSMRASLPWVNGKYSLVIERGDETPVYTINEDKLADDFKVSEDGRKTLLNMVRYTYTDLGNKSKKASVVADSATYLAEDNNTPLEKSYNNAFETNRYRAQNRANTLLKLSREQIKVVANIAALDALRVETGDLVALTRTTQGWVAKEFLVDDMRIKPDGGLTVNLVEFEPTGYDWAVSPEVVAPPDTTLIGPTQVTAPTGLTFASGTDHLILNTDGTILSRIHGTITPAADAYVSEFIVEYKRASESTYTSRMIVATGTAPEFYISGVEDSVSYDIRAKAVNTLGVESDWFTSSHTVVGKTEPPEDVTGFAVQQKIDRWLFTWDAVSDPDRGEYEIREGATWATAALVVRTSATSFILNKVDVGAATFWIKAVDTTGNYSVNAVNTAMNITAPSVVADFVAEVADGFIRLEWSGVNAGTLPIHTYEIREGVDWETGVSIALTSANFFIISRPTAGTYTFWIKAVDSGLNSSATASTDVAVITAPGQPSVTVSYDGPNAVITYTAAAGSFPVDYYEINKDAVTIATLKGTSFSVAADYLSATFSVRAIDIQGNTSNSGSAGTTITAPSVAALTNEVIDNNVLLRWDESLGTLPIHAYEVRKGATFATAEVLQEINGTFAAFFESVSGDYTYWVVAVDTAGNYGGEQSVVASVAEPPDFVLNVNWDASAFSGTKINAYIDSVGNLVYPINTTETFQQHFVNNSWNSPNDQVTAGYDRYIMPSVNSGSYQEEFDYGAVLSSTMIKIITNTNVVTGSVTVTPTIEVKLLPGDAWTDLGDVWTAFASNFQYVRVTLTFAASGGDDIVEMLGLNVILDSKLKNDAGSDSVTTAATGKVVTFNKSFVDIESITVSPNTTSNVIAIYDFTDAPNPTTFTVYLYNPATGTKVTGNFSWAAKGY